MTVDRVLCPVDFSDVSRRALHYATSVAAWYGAHLHLLHVIAEPIPPAPPLLAPVPTLIADDVRSRIQLALHELAGDTNLHESRVSETVTIGAPASLILAHAATVRADLIVLGTHGQSGIEHLLLGSTAERVVSRASCPVLTIPPAAHEPPSASQVQFKRILCAIDFSSDSLRAFEFARSLAQEDDGRITLLHVLETVTDEDALTVGRFRVGEYVQSRRHDTRDQLKALVTHDGRAWCEAEERVELGSPGRTILRVARDIGADLIVLGAQGHSGLGLLLFGSTTQTVIRRATCAVLTMRANSSAVRFDTRDEGIEARLPRRTKEPVLSAPEAAEQEGRHN